MLKIKPENFTDLHVLRYFSSFVAVSEGKVIALTDPKMTFCPLASFVFRDRMPKNGRSKEDIRKFIIYAVEEKINRLGYYTEDRRIKTDKIAVPFGASEILMYALKKRTIDCAVTVCDGAGMVIARSLEIVQGVGARMNGLFYTTPIKKITDNLEMSGCAVPFKDGEIRQIDGVKKAAELGFKKIAVTINAIMDEPLNEIRQIERDYSCSVIIMAVCATGITKEQSEYLLRYADIVWSCASNELREVIGEKAVMQFSKAIPVFALTRTGINLMSAYSDKPEIFDAFDAAKQYVVLAGKKGMSESFKMGGFDVHVFEAELPVRSKREPVLEE